MYLFTSESVSAGHPDKCADVIADTIVDRLLQRDAKARVATEVFLSGSHIVIGGEVKTTAVLEDDFYRHCALDALKNIGYPERGFDPSQTLYPDTAEIEVLVAQQSPDISMGVDQKGGEIGAGDQGMMIGFATDETEAFMPAALYYSRKLRDALYKMARAHPDDFGIDIKTQVTVDYETKANFDANAPQRIAKIVAAVPHAAPIGIEQVRGRVRECLAGALKGDPLFDENSCEFYINGTGRFVNHSPLADSGLTGRKTVADTYGAYAPVGGGSQSSKDYTKVDRTGLYAARWIAKHIVAAGLAKKALVQIAYVIGRAEPVNVTVDTMNTGVLKRGDEVLSKTIADAFALTPKWITQKFGLDRPGEGRFFYADVAAKGQVGYAEYPWEELEELAWFSSLLDEA